MKQATRLCPQWRGQGEVQKCRVGTQTYSPLKRPTRVLDVRVVERRTYYGTAPVGSKPVGRRDVRWLEEAHL